MKVKIEDLTIFSLVQVVLKNLGISSHRDGERITYSSDGVFLLKDISFERNISEEDFLLLIEGSFSLFSIIQKFLISISVEESLLTEKYIYKAKCHGMKRGWESNCLVRSSLLAVVAWFATDKHIEFNDDDWGKECAPNIDCTVFIESLNLPILLVLKLKSKNIKKVSDLQLIEDQSLLHELRAHGIQV